MFVIQILLPILLASLIEKTFPQNQPIKTSTLSSVVFNRHGNQSAGKIINKNSSILAGNNVKIPSIPQDVTINSDSENDQNKDEIYVNDLLENVDELAVIDIPKLHQGPHYELDWMFIDKDTIRVTFDLYSIPTSLLENNIYSDMNQRKSGLLALMASMPTRPLKSIASLKYFVFIIRPYHKTREIILKIERLFIRNSTENPHPHFSNSLLLTALNHHEKYSVCISYYQSNISIKIPDLLLCQDIINDYAKFADPKTDLKHGLLFITTQYSIIIALLVVLQSVFTIRKRRLAQVLARHLTTTAHSIRSTLSSVSLMRQSFSSLDAAGEHHHHTTTNQAVPREPTIEEEKKLKKRIISSQAIVFNEPSIETDDHDVVTNPDENEPFLKRVSSKNHVHFLLGPGEEDDDGGTEDIPMNPTQTSTFIEPYSDQSDALLSMAHILDTNKPWSRHNQQTGPV